jgi:predicted ribosome quality control (RQC) complex YloA/Tae2 family protein
VSLNWKEIDAVLAELPLVGSYVQRVDQPDYRNLVLALYRPGERYYLLCSLEQNATRLHRIDRKPQRPKKQQRFAQMLRARIEGGQITDAYQVHSDRIVRLEISRAQETTLLWIRLWGGQANIIATDSSLTILDAFYRRPKRNEVTGATYDPDADTRIHEADPEERKRRLEQFPTREFPGEGSFNARVAAYYAEQAEEQAVQKRRSRILNELDSQRNKITSKLKSLRDKEAKLTEVEQYKEQGDLIMSNLHAIQAGDRWLEAESLDGSGERVTIRLDPNRAPHENAELFYEQYKKARENRKQLQNEIDTQQQQLEQIARRREAVEQATTSSELAEYDTRHQSQPHKERDRSIPGIEFQSGGFKIIVGRTARENDELLRRYVKGNDVWLHVRDYPGSYVFVRHIPGKSVPLEVLLDAGNLAIHFSKARNAGRADLYYTFVKHLRRAKNGKTGLVLPTQEKNLTVDLEQERLDRLRGA